MNHQLIDQVKANLILAHDADDELIANLWQLPPPMLAASSTCLRTITRLTRCPVRPGRRL